MTDNRKEAENIAADITLVRGEPNHEKFCRVISNTIEKAINEAYQRGELAAYERCAEITNKRAARVLESHDSARGVLWALAMDFLAMSVTGAEAERRAKK